MMKKINFIDMKRGCSPFVPKLPKHLSNNLAYDDDSDNELVKALATYYEQKTEHIMLGAGSSKILEWLYSKHYDNVILIGEDFFLNNELLKFRHYTPIEVPRESDKIMESIHQCRKTDKNLIIMTLVSSVDGSLIPIDKMLDFARALKDKTPESLLLIDGAYSEFSRVDIKPLLKEENIIYLGTFSKAYGLAGLRVGYAISHQIAKKEFYKKVLYIVPSLCSGAAKYFLKHRKHINKTLAFIDKEKQRLCTKNPHLINTHSHRLLYIEKNTNELYYFLLEHKIIGRQIMYQNKSAMSFSLSIKKNNTRLLKVLKLWEGRTNK